MAVLDLPRDFVLRSLEFRQRYGLLTNDSLIALQMADEGVAYLVSADQAFDRVPGIVRAAPADLSS